MAEVRQNEARTPLLLLLRVAPHAFALIVATIGIINAQPTAAVLQSFSAWVLQSFGLVILWMSTLCLIAVLALAVSPWRSRRLGGEQARPEFSTPMGLAMLFAAGMGSGLVFWGAAEPLTHALAPPPGGQDHDVNTRALALTFLHWTLHPWAIYAASALAIGYFSYEKQKLFLPSAPFRAMKVGSPPLWGLIDFLSLIAVVFGLVASLGQGAFQAGAGLGELVPGLDGDSVLAQSITLLAMVGLATLSAAGGLSKTIGPISALNMFLCVGLLIFVCFFGPFAHILKQFAASLALFVERLPIWSTRLPSDHSGAQWSRDWTLTYFLWWVAWTPFVGAFIARISRGRTLGQFVLGVMMVPSAFSVIWFAVFGGTILAFLENPNIAIEYAGATDSQKATYILLSNLPFADFTKIAAAILICLFLITSVDSGAYVLAMMSSKGAASPVIAERVFWGLAVGALAMVTVMSGAGRSATSAFAVAGGGPLILILVGQFAMFAWAMWRAKPTR